MMPAKLEHNGGEDCPACKALSKRAVEILKREMAVIGDDIKLEKAIFELSKSPQRIHDTIASIDLLSRCYGRKKQQQNCMQVVKLMGAFAKMVAAAQLALCPYGQEK